MASSLVTLFAARDQATVLAQMYTLAGQLGVDVVGVQAERLFTALYQIEAQAKSQEDSLRVQVAQAGFLDTVMQAGSAWVDLLAQGWFGLTRAAATYTTGLASLACGSLAIGGTVPALQARWQSSTGVTFTNATAFTVTPGSTVPVVLQAVIAGTSGNVQVGLSWTNVTVLNNCTLTNPGTAGSWITSAGIDAEADATLIARCKARWAATSYGGAASAYLQWVSDSFTTQGLTNAITRVAIDDGNPNGPGSTNLYLADAAGPATAAELGIVSPYLLARRGLGTGPLGILAAPGYSLPVIATIYGNTNGVTLGTAALQSLQATIPLGGTVYFAQILDTLYRLPGVRNVAFSSPTPGTDTVLPGFDVVTFVPTLAALP